MIMTLHAHSLLSFASDAEYKKQMFDDFGEKDKHDYYYGSYSSFHIHEEMLKDTVRTRTY